MKISSPTFNNNEYVPVQYTCKGENVNPPLTFSDIPENTKSLVLFIEDIDATPKPWIHWFVFNIPPTTTFVKEHSIPEGGTEGHANGGTHGHEGPCPIYFSGIHHYRYTLLALDTILDVPNTVTKYDIEPMIQEHILAQATLIGLSTGEKTT